jgi:hypothetical protein
VIAHVQVRRGLPATEGCYQAWRAFQDRGWTVRPFESIEEFDPAASEPVVGGLDSVVQVLRHLEVEPPCIDYPEALRPFFVASDLRIVALEELRSRRAEWPLFVKPATGNKEFTGRVFRSWHEIEELGELDAELLVFVASPVDLERKVEWRAFVIDGIVRDVRPYSAVPNCDAPSTTMIQMFATQWTSIPAGCSIDVVNLGDQREPDWRIVECNDGYGIAGYGLVRATYAELLVKRWGELTRSDLTW